MNNETNRISRMLKEMKRGKSRQGASKKRDFGSVRSEDARDDWGGNYDADRR